VPSDPLDQILEAAACAKVDQLQSRMSEECALRESQHNSVYDLLEKERLMRDEHHWSLLERIDVIEDVISDRFVKLGDLLEAVATAHGRLAKQAHAHEVHKTSMTKRLNQIENVISMLVNLRSPELMVECTTSDQLCDHLSVSNTSIASRLEFLERSFGDSADKNMKKLETVRSKIDHLHERLSDESLTCRADAPSIALVPETGCHATKVQIVRNEIDHLHERFSDESPTCRADDPSIALVPETGCHATKVPLEDLVEFLGEPIPKISPLCAHRFHEHMPLRRRTNSEDLLETQDQLKESKCMQNVRNGCQRVFSAPTLRA